MTPNTAGGASGKKRLLITIGGLVAAAAITTGVFAMAGSAQEQDRAVVQADEASQDVSGGGRGTRAKATKAAPSGSSVDPSSSTATEAGTDGGAAGTGTTVGDSTTTGATAGATNTSAPGAKVSAVTSGGTATGTAGGSTTGGSSGGSAGGSTGSSTVGSTGGSTTGGSTGGGTTGGAAIAPPVPPAPAPPVTQAPAPPPPPAAPAVQCTAGGANSNAVAVAQRFCDHRAARGLAVMSRNSRLDAAAQNRAQQMANAGVLDHNGYEDLVWGACAGCSEVGENLASYSTVGDAWSFWIGSAMHSANLNHPGGGEFGVGAATAANGYIYFVHLFGWY